MYSYFLVWSPASKPSVEKLFHQIGGKKFVEKLKFPASPSFCPPFPKLFFLAMKELERLAWSIKLWLFLSLVQPNEEQKIRKPVWNVNCKKKKKIVFQIAARSSSGSWNRISLNTNDLIPLGYLFFGVCSIQVPDRTWLMCMWTFIRQKGRGQKKRKKTRLSRHPTLFFRGNLRYIFGWATVVYRHNVLKI